MKTIAEIFEGLFDVIDGNDKMNPFSGVDFAGDVFPLQPSKISKSNPSTVTYNIDNNLYNELCDSIKNFSKHYSISINPRTVEPFTWYYDQNQQTFIKALGEVTTPNRSRAVLNFKDTMEIKLMKFRRKPVVNFVQTQGKGDVLLIGSWYEVSSEGNEILDNLWNAKYEEHI